MRIRWQAPFFLVYGLSKLPVPAAYRSAWATGMPLCRVGEISLLTLFGIRSREVALVIRQRDRLLTTPWSSSRDWDLSASASPPEQKMRRLMRGLGCQFPSFGARTACPPTVAVVDGMRTEADPSYPRFPGDPFLGQLSTESNPLPPSFHWLHAGFYQSGLDHEVRRLPDGGRRAYMFIIPGMRGRGHSTSSRISTLGTAIPRGKQRRSSWEEMI